MPLNPLPVVLILRTLAVDTVLLLALAEGQLRAPTMPREAGVTVRVEPLWVGGWGGGRGG